MYNKKTVPIKTISIIPKRKVIVICLVLLFLIIGLFLYAIYAWSDPIPIIIWALVLTTTYCLAFLLLMLFIHNKNIQNNKRVLQKLTRKHNQLQSEIMIECKNKYQKKAQQDEEAKRTLAQIVSTLMNENTILQEYKNRIREIYLCSSNEETRTYALACLSCSNIKESLQLFDPIKYIRNANYARIIDINSVLLTESLHSNKAEEYLNIFHTQQKLNELLKSGTTTSGNNSTVPMLERKTLHRIDNEGER